MQRPKPPVQRLLVEVLGARSRPGLIDRNASADPLEAPLNARDVEQLDHRQPRNRAAVGPHPTAPPDQVLAAAVGGHRFAVEFACQLADGVLGGPDEGGAEVDGRARDRRGGRPAADAVAALQHDDVVAVPDQVVRRRQAGETGPDDNDIGVS